MSSQTEEVQSPVPSKKLPRLSHRAKVITALVVIGLGVVFAIFFAPPEGDSNNITADNIPGTLTVTNLVGSIQVNRGADYNHVRIMVVGAQQASKFSDDRKRSGAYTIRIALSAQADTGQQSPIGLDYAAIARLRLANGQLIAPKLANMSPNILPGQTYSGFIDFPVDTPVSLSGLVLQLGSSASVPFSL